jgi:hypothetical protein
MNVLTSAVDTAGHDPRRPRGRRIVQASLVLAVVLVVTATVWVWRHPDRTFDSGYGVGARRAVGKTLWTPLEEGRAAAPGEIYIESIEPRMKSDGAAVVVEYAICDLDPATLAAEGVGASPYGGRDRDLDRYCTRVVPAEGASMRLGTDPGRELLVGVTPTRPGRTVIQSHRIEFREGWQKGSADVHVGVVVNAH